MAAEKAITPDIPETTKQWVTRGMSTDFDDLELSENVPLPELLGQNVLVKFHYVSLNFRDLAVLKGVYLGNSLPGVVPCSDGAGEVISLGPRVTRFQIGSRVISLFNRTNLYGPRKTVDMPHTAGTMCDGVLRQYGVYDEQALVPIPESLNFQQGSTLSCAALAVWNSFHGLAGKTLFPGQYVLTQGTGGVSLFAVQFAKAAGAKVIAMTSNAAKAKILFDHGADHVLNYMADEDWGHTAKTLTPDGEGVDHVIDIGGPGTLKQSLEAVKREGVITLMAYQGCRPDEEPPSFMDILKRNVIVRAGTVGSREKFEEMLRAIEAGGIKPVIDERVWGFTEVKEAFQHMWDQNHLGKVTIKIS